MMEASKHTWADVVQFYFPNFDEEDVHHLLWSATAYPFSRARYTHKQVYRKYRQVKDVPDNQKLNTAIAIANKETEEEYEKYVKPKLDKS